MKRAIGLRSCLEQKQLYHIGVGLTSRSCVRGIIEISPILNSKDRLVQATICLSSTYQGSKIRGGSKGKRYQWRLEKKAMRSKIGTFCIWKVTEVSKIL